MNDENNFELSLLFPKFSSLFDDVEHKSLSPLSFLREFEHYWLLEVDLPLVSKKDIQVTFDENTINVQAKLKKIYSQENLGQIAKFEYFKKSILLPRNIDTKKTTAKFQKGRLEIKIQKKVTGKKIKIE